MPYTTFISDPLFGKNEIKIWATSKQSFNRYFSKVRKMYNLLMNPELDININSLEYIEIVRSTIRFKLKSNVINPFHDYIFNGNRIICYENIISCT